MIVALLLAAAPLAEARAVEVSGDVEVRIVVEPAPQTQVRGASPEVQVSVANALLTIVAPPWTGGERPSLQVSMSALESIDVKGAARVSAANVSGRTLFIQATGTSVVVLEGKVMQALEASLGGSARVDVGGLTATSVRVRTADAAQAIVRAAPGGSVYAQARKASTITIRGRGARIDRNTQEAGRILLE